MHLHGIQVLCQPLLQCQILVLGRRERAGRLESGAVFKREVLLEEQRWDLAEAGDEGLALVAATCGVLEIGGLIKRVVDDILESGVGLEDEGEIRGKVGAGDVGEGEGVGDGRRRREIAGRGGGGGPEGPGGVVVGGGARVVEDGGEVLDGGRGGAEIGCRSGRRRVAGVGVGRRGLHYPGGEGEGG